jgi:hypothetical protein
MKTIITIKLFTLFILVAYACNNQQGMKQSQPQFYATPGEAIEKAKSDLLAVIRTNKGITLGIDEKTLEAATSGAPVKQGNIDFNKLLTADSLGSFDNLQAGEMSTIFPMISGNRVITVVEINKSEKGWSITGLGGKSVSEDLNIVRAVAGDSATISVYEVPNLQTKVYSVKKAGVEMFYTDFENKFSLRQGVSAAQLIPALKRAAQEFNRKYGDKVKQQRLVR